MRVDERHAVTEAPFAVGAGVRVGARTASQVAHPRELGQTHLLGASKSSARRRLLQCRSGDARAVGGAAAAVFGARRGASAEFAAQG